MTIVVTREEADEALKKGVGPWEHLVERFKQEHDLVVKIADLNNRALFSYERDKHDRAFRVTYLGNDKTKQYNGGAWK